MRGEILKGEGVSKPELVKAKGKFRGYEAEG